MKSTITGRLGESHIESHHISNLPFFRIRLSLRKISCKGSGCTKFEFIDAKAGPACRVGLSGHGTFCGISTHKTLENGFRIEFHLRHNDFRDSPECNA
jgi:hypothetical protein